MTAENPKGDCLFLPKEECQSCRRIGCVDFQTCPAGQVVLKEGEKVIVAKPDSLLDRSEKFAL